MELIKNKSFFIGMLSGLLWAGATLILMTFFLSDYSIEESLYEFYLQNRLSGLISIAALVNLPIFFLALRKNKYAFASGIVGISLVLVLVIAFLKINA